MTRNLEESTTFSEMKHNILDEIDSDKLKLW